ncbi:hypothetical protein [Paeniglutamicibacter terrestris]|uniref:Helix-turn-helix domain-containing protein n=1 Tax=Paeniglutamicibacter terrestris TaxID=2723403 RepID=A0ABX1G960_9MICC|nr:hypothetical protein [Paeniglutamicibacter terrestris]NKG22246.1 hypothetical protein [Paeniglutamicibacter terrestris]
MSVEEVVEAFFRTPEEVAPELGLKPTTLRRLCRETGICTRLERGRITLTEDDKQRMIAHLIEAKKEAAKAEDYDPFA